MAVILNSRIWVPARLLDTSQVREHFHPTLYVKERVCEQCEYVEDRPSDPCVECQNFVGSFKLYRKGVRDGKQYIGFPFGSANLIKELWPDVAQETVVNERVAPRFKYADDWEFTWDLYPYQEEATQVLIKRKVGVLSSKPRSGKTVMAVAMAVKLGLRTIILASQEDWLDQFMTTFHEATNIQDIEKAYSKRLCGRPQSDDDYGRLPILLVTYQSFLRGSGAERLAACTSKYGLLIVDETHQVSAECYAQVLSQFNTRYRFGLTGTPNRKDGTYEVVIDKLMGPVIHETEVESLVPSVRFTKSKFTKSYKVWNSFIKALSLDERRNKTIVELAVRYVKSGHYVVIPCYHIDHVGLLVDEINKAMGKRIAAAFTGKLRKNQRKDLLEDARRGKIKVTVGIRKIVQTGINVPLWSTILEVMPISNTPQHTQEVSRILTPMDDKPKPIVHYVYDPTGISLGCLRNCVFNTHVALGHTFKKEEYEAVVADLNNMPRYRRMADGSPVDEGVKKTKARTRPDHGRRPRR